MTKDHDQAYVDCHVYYINDGPKNCLIKALAMDRLSRRSSGALKSSSRSTYLRNLSIDMLLVDRVAVLTQTIGSSTPSNPVACAIV